MTQPLGPDEEQLWRSLMKVTVSLPRALDTDLLHATGLSLTDYSVLVNLSEARDREMRMAELANTTALSASRITRVVNDLVTRRLVAKRPCAEDGRGYIASLTPEGLARLEAAYPHHLASVRQRVIDHADGCEKSQFAEFLRRVGESLAP